MLEGDRGRGRGRGRGLGHRVAQPAAIYAGARGRGNRQPAARNYQQINPLHSAALEVYVELPEEPPAALAGGNPLLANVAAVLRRLLADRRPQQQVTVTFNPVLLAPPVAGHGQERPARQPLPPAAREVAAPEVARRQAVVPQRDAGWRLLQNLGFCAEKAKAHLYIKDGKLALRSRVYLNINSNRIKTALDAALYISLFLLVTNISQEYAENADVFAEAMGYTTPTGEPWFESWGQLANLLNIAGRLLITLHDSIAKNPSLFNATIGLYGAGRAVETTTAVVDLSRSPSEPATTSPRTTCAQILQGLSSSAVFQHAAGVCLATMAYNTVNTFASAPSFDDTLQDLATNNGTLTNSYVNCTAPDPFSPFGQNDSNGFCALYSLLSALGRALTGDNSSFLLGAVILLGIQLVLIPLLSLTLRCVGTPPPSEIRLTIDERLSRSVALSTVEHMVSMFSPRRDRVQNMRRGQPPAPPLPPGNGPAA